MNQAHYCPVCNGRGKVSSNYYDLELSTTTSASEEPCRSCNGLGYIWYTTIYAQSLRIPKKRPTEKKCEVKT